MGFGTKGSGLARALRHLEALTSLQAKLDVVLRPADKTALQRLADARGVVTTNLVSSGIWQYAIEPVITAIG